MKNTNSKGLSLNEAKLDTLKISDFYFKSFQDHQEDSKFFKVYGQAKVFHITLGPVRCFLTLLSIVHPL